ncbi:protein phosphatase 1 regulatory subunit 15A [Hoplias malabaricus]|uniref:protein phosphatase 1 regulatory subunit 15A n=1 Tax=Hoplias malabaricus TaxID=27720 RepID=UPI00346320DA
MAPFISDQHHPSYWFMTKAVQFDPPVKNLEHSSDMKRTSENIPLSLFTVMPVLTVFERIGLRLWEAIRKVIHRCMSVTELLNSRVFVMCGGETLAMTGESKKITVGLRAQEKLGFEASSKEVRQTSMGKNLLGLQMNITEEPLTMSDEIADNGGEVVLSDWLEWESEEDEEEDGKMNDDVLDDKDQDMEESSGDEEETTDWNDEEDSDWSDGEGDSEASTESTELWESFLNSNDPYNPLYFTCSTGDKAKSTDSTKDCKTSRPQVSEVQKSTPGDVEENSPMDSTKERAKKVCFGERVQVHHLVSWGFASRAARDGSCWLELARDRERFRRRVEKTGEVINPCLTAQHRARVWGRLQRAAVSEPSSNI